MAISKGSCTRAAVTALLAGASLLAAVETSAAQNAPPSASAPSPPISAPGYPQGAPELPPPTGPNGGAAPAYSPQQQQADHAYGQAYSGWAQQNCIIQQQNNTAAGAVIGGVLGAAAGGAIGHSGGAAVAGAAVGAIAGSQIGANSAASACPPGYALRSGAPAFAYGAPVYAPPWYQPWVFVNGAWFYYPYGAWYWGSYWPYYRVYGPVGHPGWHGRGRRW